MDSAASPAPAKKIRIAFDASCLVTSHKSGVAFYTAGLVSQLAAQYPEQLELVGHYCNFLGRQTIPLPQAPNIRYRPTRLLPSRALNLLRRAGLWLPFELLLKQRTDFHLFPAFIGWPSLFKTPSAPVIHDLTYLDFPQYVSDRARHDMQRFVPATIRRAAFVITISHSSEAGLNKAYPGLAHDTVLTSVPPVGLVPISGRQAEQVVGDLGIQQSYILFFGTLEPRKNLIGLLAAYELLPAALRQQYALVLAGGQGWHDEEILQKIESLRAANFTIYQTGYVSDEQRAALFTRAALFVLPSHYEGFGMPVLEAMSYGTPVLVSNIAALREVAAAAADYCDPASPADIAAKLSHLLQDAKRRQRLVDAGTKRLNDFSWQSVATTVYDQIMKAVV